MGALDSELFIHGLTFDAVPVGAVAAMEVQGFIMENDLLKNVKNQGDYLGKSLRDNLSGHPNVGDIRGQGLFLGIELVEDKVTKNPFNPELRVAHKIVNLAKSPEFNMTFYPGVGTVDGVKGTTLLLHLHLPSQSKM